MRSVAAIPNPKASKPVSRNREKAHLRLARLDERIANQRRDYHHKLSRQLVEENQCIGLEDLNVSGMWHHLAKSIGDVGWSAFITMLVYKADWYGCRVEKVNRWYPSSKTCSACGTVLVSIALHVRQWQCPVCDVLHDRDVQCSRNGCCHSGTNILNQSTVGAMESNAWGQACKTCVGCGSRAALDDPGSQSALTVGISPFLIFNKELSAFGKDRVRRLKTK